MPDEILTNALSNQKKSSSKKKRGLLGRVFRFLVIFSLSLIVLFINLLFILQIPFVKNKLLDFSISKINSSLKDKECVLNIENLEGNLFSTIKLNNINFVVKNDTLFKANSIEVKFILFPIINKKINISDLIIDKPQINFTKIKDKNDSLIWNFLYVIKSENPPDTTKKEFDWDIRVTKLELKDCDFKMLAIKNANLPIRMLEVKRTDHFDLNNLDLTNLNLELSAGYSKQSKKIEIRKFNFNTNSQFTLESLMLTANIGEEGTLTLEDMYLHTNNSNCKIPHLKVNNFYPLDNFTYEKLGDDEIETVFFADRFDFSDFKYFIPDFDILKGKFYIDLKCNGLYKDLKIDNLKVKSNNSDFAVTGNIKNLNIPEKIILDVSLKNCTIDPNDTKNNFPGIGIPDFGHIGMIYTSIIYRGDIHNFYTEYDISTGVGNTFGKTYFNISSREFKYETNNTFNNVNIGKLIKNNDLESNLTGNIKLNGAGTDYKTLSANIDYNLQNSKIYKQNILQSSGSVKINHLNTDININYVASSINTQVQGKVDISNLINIKYDLTGNVKNFDISGFTNKSSDKSNLNFTFNVKGQGTDIKNINGVYSFKIFQSRYNTYLIPETPLLAMINNSPSNNDIDITSDIIDFRAKGNFSLTTLPDIISSNINKITYSIEKQFNSDSAGALKINEQAVIHNNYENMNMAYSLKIRNFVPINILLPDNKLNLTADISGEIKNNENSFSFNAKGTIKNFSYKDSLFGFKNSIVQIDLSNPYNTNQLNNLYSNVVLKTDGININGMMIDTLNTSFNLQNEQNKFYIRSVKDTNVKFVTLGTLIYNSLGSDVIIDILNFNYKNFNFKNSNPILISYKITDTGNIINFQNFTLNQDKQKISLKGYYSLNSKSNLVFSASDINIKDLSRAYLTKLPDKNLINGNIKYFNIKYEGTLKDPNILVEVSTDNVKFDTNNVGYLYAIVKYKDNFLNPDIVLIDPVTNGKLLITGKIPFNNPIVTDTLDLDLLNKKINLDINADNIDITLLEPYVPYVYDLHGILKGNLAISGTAREPDLNGEMTIRKGSFDVGLNGMNYGFNLDLSPQNQKLFLKNSKIFYPEEADKFITVDGYLDFTNLNLNNYAFDITGDIKVLDNKITKNDLGIYGELYAGSGTPNLKISGDSMNTTFSGNLVIKKGRISMSANENKAFSLYDDNFVYKVLIDTGSYSVDSLKSMIAKLTDSLNQKENINPFDKFLSKKDTLDLKNKINGSKFLYDISVSTLNNISVNFIIDEKTKQEFNGEITASLFVDNQHNDSLEVRGRVDVQNNSIYKFYKIFNATGYVVFNGNPTNPELHINAEYTAKSAEPNNAGSVRDVTVQLAVTGVASKPILTWSVLVNGNSIGGGDQTDQALSFIVFGKLKDELSSSQRNSLFSNIGVNVGANIISGYLSGFVQNILPFIVNTEINYTDNESNNVIQGTDIRFTAEFGDATVRFGGQLFYDISNTNFVVEYPLNKLLRIKSLSNNLIFQFERFIDPFTQNSTQINTENRTGGLILYKINF